VRNGGALALELRPLDLPRTLAYLAAPELPEDRRLVPVEAPQMLLIAGGILPPVARLVGVALHHRGELLGEVGILKLPGERRPHALVDLVYGRVGVARRRVGGSTARAWRRCSERPRPTRTL